MSGHHRHPKQQQKEHDHAVAEIAEEHNDERFRAGQQTTWVSVGVNVLLVCVQVVVGVIAHSQSLIADGLHSASDLLADFMVLFANRQSRHPADANHPYGHARVETAASLLLGALLAATGGAMLIAAGSRLSSLNTIPPVAPMALWVALIALVAKELLFRYMLRIAERVRSPLLVANAWHARSDAASSLVVAVGIGGNLLGLAFADLLAAAIVGFMIVRMGLKFAYDALRELIDTALSEEETSDIRKTLLATPGVRGLHELRTRRMAHQALVDAHVLVSPRISVSEGHRIAEAARARVLERHPQVLDVLVHVDCENDLVARNQPLALPSRSELEARLATLLAGLPAPEKVVLHYLGGRVEAEVMFGQGDVDAATVRDIENLLADGLCHDPHFRSIIVLARFAPKQCNLP
jgi:cation diffusion facilitator family transporter